MRRTLLAAALCAIALLLVQQAHGPAQTSGVGQQPQQPMPPRPPTQRDLEALKKVFGVNQIVISLLQQPQAVSGSIVDVVDIFGRRFLVITDNEGRNYLVNPELITAIRQK
jgi:hypothetical protein